MNAEEVGPLVVWGYSVVEPDRGHVRGVESHVVEGAVVGFAICEAFLVGDMPDQNGEFPKCSECLRLLKQSPDAE